MTQVTVVRLAGDAALSAAQPLGVTGKATGRADSNRTWWAR
jgi:hypothetical protein